MDPYLTIFFLLWSQGSSLTVLNWYILNKGIAFWDREERLSLLAIVKFYSTVVTKDMREERFIRKTFLVNFKCHSKLLAIFRIRQLQFVFIKILQKETEFQYILESH